MFAPMPEEGEEITARAGEPLPDGTVIANQDAGPACPVAGEIPYWVANAVAEVEGIGEVVVNLIWDPPWTMDRMSEDAKLALGID